MEIVILKKIFHRDQSWFGLFGPNRTPFNFFVRNNKAIWSRTWKCYLMPFNRVSYEKIVSGLQSSYNIDNEGLKTEKKTEKTGSVKPVMKNRVQKVREDVEPLPFLTDTKGLADWELRQQ